MLDCCMLLSSMV